MATLLPNGKQSFTTATGAPLVAGRVYTYAAGTSTPQVTYADAAGTTPNANPVILDSRGEATIFWSGSYKVILKDSLDVTIWTVDGVGATDLGSTTSATAGAGSVGFGYALAYATGSVGRWLQDLGTSVGSTLIGFIQAGTGAALRTLQAKSRDTVSVKDFGATGDGSTDDTAAMQLAHNTGKMVYYPAGTYKFSTLATPITAGGIIGAGKGLSILSSTDTTTANLMTFSADFVSGVPGTILTFRDFTLIGQGAGSKTTGAGIQITAPTADNQYASFIGCMFLYCPIGIDFLRASLWKVASCDFLGYKVAGVQVANVFNNDAGDGSVSGCLFNTPYSGGSFPTGVLHKSAGGMKVVGNKFLGGNYGYLLAYTDSAASGLSTSDLHITANSIENFYSAAIALTRISAGLASFLNVTIAGNQIAVAKATPTAYLITSDSSAFLQTVSITGNTFQLPGTTNSYGITLVSATAVAISANVFRGNGGTSQAIQLTSCVDAKIGTNTYSNITTPYVLSTPGANNSIALDSQSGAASTLTTGWTAYGGLFISASVTVTFAQAFATTPNSSDVLLDAAAGSGEVGGIVVSVSKTQLVFKAISATTAIAANINWKVWGVL